MTHGGQNLNESERGKRKKEEKLLQQRAATATSVKLIPPAIRATLMIITHLLHCCTTVGSVRSFIMKVCSESEMKKAAVAVRQKRGEEKETPVDVLKIDNLSPSCSAVTNQSK